MAAGFGGKGFLILIATLTLFSTIIYWVGLNKLKGKWAGPNIEERYIEREIMEIDGVGAMMVNKTKKSKLLSVEDYLDFFDNRDTLHLTVNQLQQILGMHGFRKIIAQKRNLIDIVSAMDLSDLRRSTLSNGSVSGDARLVLEEVINDLKHLDWKECHVTSLLTQGTEASATAKATATSTSTSCNTVSVKRRGSKRRKTSEQAGVGSDISINSTGTTIAAGSTAAGLNFCG